MELDVAIATGDEGVLVCDNNGVVMVGVVLISIYV